MSLHFGLFEDESDATNSFADPDDEHTLSAFGDVSLSREEMLGFVPNNIRHRNRLRLKAKTKRKSAQHNPQPKVLTGSLWDPLTNSPCSSPLSPAEFFNRCRQTVRRAFRRAQAEAAEAEMRARASDSRESTSSNSSASFDGQSVIVKDVYEVPELAKLPPRAPIPKWDVDD
ncbi:hypothetical protein EDB19DRAFT_1829209 [Suillus lakei]|nr:hypothetical protein EDB19DRAFT_1829209 [Suillus lakei]